MTLTQRILLRKKVQKDLKNVQRMVQVARDLLARPSMEHHAVQKIMASGMTLATCQVDLTQYIKETTK